MISNLIRSKWNLLNIILFVLKIQREYQNIEIKKYTNIFQNLTSTSMHKKKLKLFYNNGLGGEL
jgi:hypothetical protein